ncbi:MAG: DUF3781 domain-containing protein [Ruminococcus sp.]|nr:DUF3781 domain-containing protein [Ruminococcus sp.]
MDKNLLLENISKIHTTELGKQRISKNLNIELANAVKYCISKILSPDCIITRNGKNWYCCIENIVITVNANAFTIITAHRKDKK